mmetsp:Transcript_34484/g.86614  ORF Transcript_34484/g.86614 Transcript_34484/m.86614 type:complete len:239 (+) Transcript_34484:78-794(+)
MAASATTASTTITANTISSVDSRWLSLFGFSGRAGSLVSLSEQGLSGQAHLAFSSVHEEAQNMSPVLFVQCAVLLSNASPPMATDAFAQNRPPPKRATFFSKRVSRTRVWMAAVRLNSALCMEMIKPPPCRIAELSAMVQPVNVELLRTADTPPPSFSAALSLIEAPAYATVQPCSYTPAPFVALFFWTMASVTVPVELRRYIPPPAAAALFFSNVHDSRRTLVPTKRAPPAFPEDLF